MTAQLVTNRLKQRFVHINPGGKLWETKCGAWKYYGDWYNKQIKVVDPADIEQYHRCRKCFT
jgi:hypothetical protein